MLILKANSSLHIARISRCLLVTIALVTCSVPGFSQALNSSKPAAQIYGQIAEDGLSGTISSGNLAIIISACQEAHSDPDGKDWSDDTGGGVSNFFRFMDRETAKILNLAVSADTSAEDRAKVLHHFGLILRGLEEFYLKSNYLELKAESSDNQLDPYNIELINWTKIGKDSRSIAMTGFKFGNFDKSSAKLPEGSKTINKATYHSIARELAVKEALREWNTVERLIRVRYPQRANEIAVALKSATCPASVKFEQEE